MKVLLVETHTPGAKGSMCRYANLVSRALRNLDSHPELEVSRIQLSLPFSLLRRMPGALTTWINHLWMALTGSARVKRLNPDLVHILDGSYAYLLHGIGEMSAIATVHDLIPLLQDNGQFGDKRGSWLGRKLVKSSIAGLRHCAYLLADSSNTAKDLMVHAGITEERILVAPLALDPEFVCAVENQKTTDPLETAVSPSHILHIGNNGYYKNREGVIRIFAKVRETRDVKLVMAGSQPTESLERLVRALSLEDYVKFVIDPDDSMLVDLYSRAALFLFPSLYEGFGWPPLEAMACGCPVVCSSEGSLREIVGDAALLRSAADEEGLAYLCLSILEDRKLAESLSMKGVEWSRRYNLECMRSDLVQAYASGVPGLRRNFERAGQVERIK